MSVYVVFRVSNPDKMEGALNMHLPGKYMKVSEGEYLASASGTAKTLSDKLGVSDGSVGSAIIFKMANYFGRSSSEIWDWIKTEAEASDG